MPDASGERYICRGATARACARMLLNAGHTSRAAQRRAVDGHQLRQSHRLIAPSHRVLQAQGLQVAELKDSRHGIVHLLHAARPRKAAQEHGVTRQFGDANSARPRVKWLRHEVKVQNQAANSFKVDRASYSSQNWLEQIAAAMRMVQLLDDVESAPALPIF